MKNAKNVLEMLYEDIPNDVPCKIHIYGYYKNDKIVCAEGYPPEVYDELIEGFVVEKLCETRLQYLCYCPADGYLELDFVRLLHKG